MLFLFKEVFADISPLLITDKPDIILGIDPGTLFMGYGLISACKNKVVLVEMGVLKLNKREDHAERLQLIFMKIESLIKLHKPVAVAIEAPFFGKNVQSMLKLVRAQGVAIAAAMVHGLRAAEYAPRKVKQSITGRGNATKEQVVEMLHHTLNFDDSKLMDATDAVAVALCHYYQLSRHPEIVGSATKHIAKNKKANSWDAFISANPGRVKQ